ncbi:MAG: alpha/beta fold hydrolase [Wenzhouxiangella sp.]|jgi:pimeloyl-ACP methyl ester carboxylesterase|nr:alpha/beta fold hydrolase [Wenzhouxiangella sp.]
MTEAIDPAQAECPPVVLVHGLWYGPVSLTLVARRLDARGFRTHRFSYPTLRQSLAVNARALFDYARSLQTETLHFVGHSLGGLVILRMFDEWTGLPPGRVVLLGSPVQGSAAAGRIAEMKITRPVIGKARTALEYGFSHAPAGRDTGIVAGTRSMGLGRMFQHLPLPHDGTIAAAETRLPGAADTIKLPVSHTGLVLSAEVVAAVAGFLRCGRFDRSA